MEEKKYEAIVVSAKRHAVKMLSNVPEQKLPLIMINVPTAAVV